LKWDSSKSAAHAFYATVRIVHGGPRDEIYHVECCASRNDGIFIFDVFNASSGQTDRNDGEESEHFSNKCCDIGDLLFHETALPGISVWINFHDLFIGSLLDFLAVRRGEIRDAHNEVSRDCVEASRDHGQANRLDLI
jgi:hypothetical protein